VQAPKDVSLWLRFIDFQDTGYMSNVTRRMTASSRAALFDRKIGIYERAMKENPGNEDLLSAYMICLEERMEYVEETTENQFILFYFTFLTSSQVHGSTEQVGGHSQALPAVNCALVAVFDLSLPPLSIIPCEHSH